MCSAARTQHLPFAPTAEAFNTAVAPVDSTDTIGVHTAAQVETLQQMMLPADTAALRPSALKPSEVPSDLKTKGQNFTITQDTTLFAVWGED
ncbi:MAG: hypothetical protein ACFNP8_07005, partial [Alloprevotella sp.]